MKRISRSRISLPTCARLRPRRPPSGPCPCSPDLRAELALLARRAGRAAPEHVRARRHALERARARLGDPRRLLDERRQALDEVAERARRHLTRQLATSRDGLRALETRLHRAHPHRRILEQRNVLASLRHRLEAAPRTDLARRRHAVDALRGKLDALSPLNVLERGFSLAQLPDGRLLTRAADARPGDEIRVRLRRGEVRAEVRETHDETTGTTDAVGDAPPRRGGS